MNENHHHVAVGVFADRAQAECAVDELMRAGFRNDQIGVVARGDAGTMAGPPNGDSSAEGAVAGAVAGAAAGGLVGLGILAGVIPVIGPIIAGGTLAVILANAAGGAAIAGVLGALIGLGIPEEDARHYEGEIQSGRTLVTVKAVEARYDDACAILRKFGASNESVKPQAAYAR